MNKIERIADKADPRLSVLLRALKMRWRQDTTSRLIQSMIHQGDIVVDVGANRGVYAYLMSVKVGRSGRVHAVEPFPGNRERLQTVASWRGNIAVHSVAVSDRSGSDVLWVPVYGGHLIDALATLAANHSWDDEDSYVVPVRTLDDLLAEEHTISFLKCDVEGYEQRVFQGAARIIERDHPIVLAEVEQRHRNDDIGNTFKFFANAGYSGWFIAGARLRPLKEFDISRDQLEFIQERFVPYAMPVGYVSDFLFCPPHTNPARLAGGISRETDAGHPHAVTSGSPAQHNGPTERGGSSGKL